MSGSEKRYPEHWVEVFIGVGSNVGDVVANCDEARRRVERAGRLEVVATSRLYRTEPVGYADQQWFVNGVLHCRTSFPPRSLLRHLKLVERRMGREPVHRRWGPRIIDLDILFYGGETISEPELEIPHPRLHLRRFVLVPLADVAPHFVHPGCGKSVKELLDTLVTTENVEPVPGSEASAWRGLDLEDSQERA